MWPAGWSHQPTQYVCPICEAFAGRVDQITNADYVMRNNLIHAVISPVWWGKCRGQVVIAPNAHWENLYTLPHDIGHAIFDATQQIAVRMRTHYGCTGISLRQHNEPDGNQTVWHFHQHIIARWPDDQLTAQHRATNYPPPHERRRYAELLQQDGPISVGW